ncbi:SHOCT domain-containing protein [Mesorhizobium captivum]|uniref:SHOCT domain-containing protein n=1 Tax=Mesorhizobium captivum TaxID=3072319 RepID=UPI003D31A271
MVNVVEPMIFGPLLMILILAVLLVAAVVLVRGPGRPWSVSPHRSPASRPPLDILRERFARGEIDKDEFEERRRALREWGVSAHVGVSGLLKGIAHKGPPAILEHMRSPVSLAELSRENCPTSRTAARCSAIGRSVLISVND